MRALALGAQAAAIAAGLWLLARLPERAALGLAAGLAGAFARLPTTRRRVALENLRAAFPDWSEARRRRTLVASFANLGRSAVELARVEELTALNVRERIRIEGYDCLETARKRSESGGVILLTAHLGPFELLLVGCALHGLPLAVVHRTLGNPRLDRRLTAWREAAGVRVLRLGGAARGALRALREGRLLALPLDQYSLRRDGVYVPFFGRPASTRSAPARIAMRTGTPVLCAFVFREAGGPPVVRFGPEVGLLPEGASADRIQRDLAVWENVRRMARAVEEAIRAAPDQWIWGHRRWKNPPEAVDVLGRAWSHAETRWPTNGSTDERASVSPASW